MHRGGPEGRVVETRRDILVISEPVAKGTRTRAVEGVEWEEARAEKNHRRGVG